MKRDKSKKRAKRLNIKTRRILILLSSIIIVGLSSGMFILYGPWSWVRNRLITTAMTTMSHQYLARWFYDEDTINEVLANNKVIESGEDTDLNLIKIGDEKKKYSSSYEKDILDRKKGDLYKVIKVSGTGYNGYLVAIYDPSKVKMAISSRVGKTGQSLKVIAKNNKAIVAINASGFYDPDWNSNGGIPHGTIIKDSKIVWDYEDAKVGGGFIGFTKDNKLMLGRMTAQQALNKGMRDAMEFGPFLIVNGKKSFIKGDGGWGIAPRTAVGQRKDGIVLFAVIDGRGRNHSIGIDMVGMTELLYNYGAYNAANMDGGSSTGLVINNKLINSPTAGGAEGLRNIPNAWIVTE